MFQAATCKVLVPSSADFGELPEGAIDIFAKDPPERKGAGRQRPTVLRKNGAPGRRALSPIKEESPLTKPSPSAHDVLNRLKERSNKRLQSVRKRASKERDTEHRKTAARKEKSKENETTITSLRGRDSKANGQTVGQASKGRGGTISSLVKRFRESPPLPREQRDGSLGAPSKAQGGSNFWWIEVGENTSARSTGGETQVEKAPTSTPSFFDIDNVDTFNADTVLAKSKQLTEEDAKHKEMLDRLCKKYLNSDEQASTPSLANEVGGIEWGWTMGQGRAEPNFEERDTADVLEKWRKRWKNEIDISSPVKTAVSSDVDVRVGFDSLLNGVEASATSSSIIDFMDGSLEWGRENSLVTKGGLKGLGFGGGLGEFPKVNEDQGRSMVLIPPEKQNSTGHFEWLGGPGEVGNRRDSSAMDIDSPEPLMRLQYDSNSGETPRCSYQLGSLWESGHDVFPRTIPKRVSTIQSMRPQFGTQHVLQDQFFMQEGVVLQVRSHTVGIEGSPMDVDDRPNGHGWKGQQNTSFFVSLGKPYSRWDRPPLPKKFGGMVNCSSPPGTDKMDEDGRSPTMGGVLSTLVECTVTNFLFSNANADSPKGSAMEIEPEGDIGKGISFFTWNTN